MLKSLLVIRNGKTQNKQTKTLFALWYCVNMHKVSDKKHSCAKAEIRYSYQIKQVQISQFCSFHFLSSESYESRADNILNWFCMVNYKHVQINKYNWHFRTACIFSAHNNKSKLTELEDIWFFVLFCFFSGRRSNFIFTSGLWASDVMWSHEWIYKYLMFTRGIFTPLVAPHLTTCIK